MKVIQVIGMLLFFVAINGAMLYRLWRLMPPLHWLRIPVMVLLVVIITAPFLVMAKGEIMPLPVVSLIYIFGTSWFIALIYLILFFVLLDGFSLSGLKVLNQFRLESWQGTLTLVVLMVALGLYGYQNYQLKERIELNLPLDKDLSVPVRMVVVSDLHLGYSIGRKELEGWVELINREHPDLILLVGDVIDTSLRPLQEETMAEVLRNLKSRYGVYAVPGNHEQYVSLAKSATFFRDANVRLLCDEAMLIDNRCYLVGRDDWMNQRRQSLASLLAPLDRRKPVVLLDHQPRALAEAQKERVDLLVAGHTHRGQIWPVSLLVDRLYEQSHGYRYVGTMHSYVSSGLGIWGGKFRIGTNSEYVVVTLFQH